MEPLITSNSRGVEIDVHKQTRWCLKGGWNSWTIRIQCYGTLHIDGRHNIRLSFCQPTRPPCGTR